MGEDIEFNISIELLREEYIKALLAHSNNGRYNKHMPMLELELLVEGNGDIYLSFICKSESNNVAMDYGCEFTYILFTNDGAD